MGNTIFLSQSAYCSGIMKLVEMEMVKTAPMLQIIKDLVLHPGSGKPENKERSEFLPITNLEPTLHQHPHPAQDHILG